MAKTTLNVHNGKSMEDKHFSDLGRVEAIRQLYEGTAYEPFAPVRFESAAQAVVTSASRLFVEGIDFNLVYFPLKHLGYKCVTAATGELYAAFAHPQTLQLRLGVSAKLDFREIRELWEGAVTAAREHGYGSVGLDLVPSPNGLTISVSATGGTTRLVAKRRLAPRSKDLLCISGNLGAAYLGLQLLERGRTQFEAGKEKVETELSALVKEKQAMGTDAREVGIALVRRLLQISGINRPAIVLYFAPPYCPHSTLKEDEKEKFDSLPDQYSHLYLAIGGVLSAVILIEDPIKDEAKDAIRALHEAGFSRVVMLTGDSGRTAKAVAKLIGVDDFRAEVLPEDKAAFIKQEHEAGRKVVMVGDGVNDLPALSAADVGVAINSGAAIAREIADITISADDLRELVVLRRLSSALMKRIDGNYRRIMAFNGGLIGLGLLGMMPPARAALLHNISTIYFSVDSMKNLL